VELQVQNKYNLFPKFSSSSLDDQFVLGRVGADEFVKPPENLSMPSQGVLRFEYPVVLFGKVQKTRRDTSSLKSSERRNTLRFGDTEVCRGKDEVS
jgi:hypothetical protein